MLLFSDLKPGDILVQCGGEPWKTGAKIFTGHPFPHAMMVTLVDGDNLTVIEDSSNGVSEHLFNVKYNNLTTFPLDHYEVWRPRCSDEIKQSAITWARSHINEG